MRVNTVLLPVKEKRYNPMTQREELMPTGYLQEFSAGEAIGRPIKEPSMGHVAQERAMPSSASRGQEGYHSATLYSPDVRPLTTGHIEPQKPTRSALWAFSF